LQTFTYIHFVGHNLFASEESHVCQETLFNTFIGQSFEVHEDRVVEVNELFSILGDVPDNLQIRSSFKFFGYK